MPKFMEVLSSVVGPNAITAQNTKMNARDATARQNRRQARSKRSDGRRRNGYFVQPRTPPHMRSLDDSTQRTLDDSTQRTLDDSTQRTFDDSTRSKCSDGRRSNGYFVQPRKPPHMRSLDDSTQKTLDDSTQRNLDDSTQRTLDDSTQRTLDDSYHMKLGDSSKTLDDSSQRRKLVSFFEQVEIVDYQEDRPTRSFQLRHEAPAPIKEPVADDDDDDMYFM